jgi:Ca2+-binding RTX toxin-like protein
VGRSDTGLLMKEGTSPSIDHDGDVAFEGLNGTLWLWKAPKDRTGNDPNERGNGADTGLGMMAGTSPSISRDADPPAAQIAAAASGSDGDDRLKGGSRNDLIFGRKGDDVVRGGSGNDVIYGGRGHDVIYGGPGNDRIYDEPGNDRIRDHRGRTRVSLSSGRNRVDVRDGRGDDRVVCAPGSRNRIRADRGDRLARACRGAS